MVLSGFKALHRHTHVHTRTAPYTHMHAHTQRHMCTWTSSKMGAYADTGRYTHSHMHTRGLFPLCPHSRPWALGHSQESELRSESGTNHFLQTPGGGPHELSFALLLFSPEISQVTLAGVPPPPWVPGVPSLVVSTGVSASRFQYPCLSDLLFLPRGSSK